MVRNAYPYEKQRTRTSEVINADFTSSFKISFSINQIGIVIPTVMTKGRSVSENDTKYMLLKYNIITGKIAKRTG